MNRTHIVREGDTYSSLAIEYYGDITQQGTIKASNPQGLIVGRRITIPELQGFEQVGQVDSPNKSMTVKVGDEEFVFFSQLSIESSIDKFAMGFKFTVPIGPNEDFIQAFSPFNSTTIKIYIDGKLYITGLCETISRTVSTQGQTISVEGASYGYDIFHSTLPPNMYPVSFENKSLSFVVDYVLKPFNVSVSKPSTGRITEVFKNLTMAPTAKVGEFIAQCCKSKGYMIKSTKWGGLEIFSSDKPKRRHIIKQDIVLTYADSFSMANRFSVYTGLAQERKEVSIQHQETDTTVSRRKYLTKVFGKSSKQDIATALRLDKNRNIGKSESYSITIKGYTIAGVVPEVGDAITLDYEGTKAFAIYKTNLIIASINFRKGAEETMSLVLVDKNSYASDFVPLVKGDSGPDEKELKLGEESQNILERILKGEDF